VLQDFYGQLKFHPPFFSILSLAAILVGSRDQRTHIWKGAIQESFQQSLVDIGSVVSEVKMSSNFNCRYMARNSLTFIPDFSVKFFFQPIYTDYAN
jgi:hypothetical protein